MLRILTVALTGLAMFVGIPGATSAQESTLEAVKSRGVLVVGVNADYPPFSHTDEDGKLIGFDADLAKYVADKLGVGLELRPVTTGNRIPMLLNGNIDVAISSFTITQKRDEAVDFTIPYMIMGIGMLVKKGSGITGYADLAGKTVSFTQGTPFAESIKKDQPEAKPLVFQDTAQGFLAVLGGKADAFLDDAAPLYNFARQHSSEVVVAELEGSRVPMGLAIAENDSNWRDYLNWTLIEAWEDGTYHKLYKDWFQSDPPEGFRIPEHRWYQWGE